MIRRGRARGALVGLAAAVIALAVMVPVLLLARNDDAPPATDPTTTTVTTTEVATTTIASTTTVAPTTTVAAATTLPATTTTEATQWTTTPPPPPPPPTPAILEMTWTQAPTQEAFGLNDGIWKVIEGGPGFIAVGNVLDVNQRDRCFTEDACEGYVDAAVWVSTDGLAWEKVGDPAEFTGVPSRFGTEMNQVMMDVAAGPGGYVAVGWVDDATGDTDPPIWFSPDGLEWERIRGELDGADGMMLGAVIADESGYLAAGTGAWRSPDGRSWTRVDDGSLGMPGFPDGQSWRLTTNGDRYVFTTIGGGEQGPAGYDGGVAIVSSDAITWDVYLLTEGGFVSDVGVLDGRFVAAGFDASGQTLWVSDDGTEWERLETFGGADRAFFPRVPVAFDTRWVVTGIEFLGFGPSGTAPIFASADGGLTWHEVATLDASAEGRFAGTVDQRPAGIRDLIALGDGFLAVGGTGNGSAPVWFGTWNQ